MRQRAQDGVAQPFELRLAARISELASQVLRKHAGHCGERQHGRESQRVPEAEPHEGHRRRHDDEVEYENPSDGRQDGRHDAEASRDDEHSDREKHREGRGGQKRSTRDREQRGNGQDGGSRDASSKKERSARPAPADDAAPVLASPRRVALKFLRRQQLLLILC